MDFTSEGEFVVEEDDNIVYEDSEDSEDSAEDYAQVSETVREDMTKLEKTFQAKGLKFRMIDRIGEGRLSPVLVLVLLRRLPRHALKNCDQELSLPSTRLKICITTFTRTIGISKPRTGQNGPRRRSRSGDTRAPKTLRAGRERCSHASLPSRRYTSRAVPRESKMNWSCCTTSKGIDRYAL